MPSNPRLRLKTRTITSGLAILAALVGCLAMAGGCAAATQSGLYGINDIRTMSAAERAENERLLDVLPDRAKPSVRAELKCSACVRHFLACVSARPCVWKLG